MLRAVASLADRVCWLQVAAYVEALDAGHVPDVPKFGNDVPLDDEDVFDALESMF